MRNSISNNVFVVAFLVFISNPILVYADQLSASSFSLGLDALLTVFVFLGFLGAFLFFLKRQMAIESDKTQKRSGKSTYTFGPNANRKARRNKKQ